MQNEHTNHGESNFSPANDERHHADGPPVPLTEHVDCPLPDISSLRPLPAAGGRHLQMDEDVSGGSFQLDAHQVQILVLHLIIHVLRLLQLPSRDALGRELVGLASRGLPANILEIIRALVATCLKNARGLSRQRSDYVATLLSGKIDRLTAAVSILGCAGTDFGYDVVTADRNGATSIHSILLPPELLDSILAAVRGIAAEIATVQSFDEARERIRDLAAGRLPQPLADALAFAIIAGLSSDDTPAELQDFICGVREVQALTDRVAQGK